MKLREGSREERRESREGGAIKDNLSSLSLSFRLSVEMLRDSGYESAGRQKLLFFCWKVQNSPLSLQDTPWPLLLIRAKKASGHSLWHFTQAVLKKPVFEKYFRQILPTRPHTSCQQRSDSFSIF